jgi:hypothetical protein
MKRREIFWSMGEPYCRYEKFDKLRFCRIFRFQNPFKRYEPGMVIPKIEILQRIALMINVSGRCFSVKVGWLNFSYTLLAFMRYKVQVCKVKGKQRERLIEEYKKQFHVINWNIKFNGNAIN